MISMWVLIGLIVSAISVSVLGAGFSILGLADLFSGAVMSVMAMAASLEFSKFFIAAYLHQAKDRLGLTFKVYLGVSVVVLSCITSMGIFGYLSGAYQEASSTLEAETIRQAGLMADKTRMLQEAERIQKGIDEIPVTRISRKMEARKEFEPILANLNAEIAKTTKLMTEGDLKIIEIKKRVGPLIYIAKAFNVDIDSVVKYLILILVLVFDPLAICMVIAVSESLQSRKRYKDLGQTAAPVVPLRSSPTPLANMSPQNEALHESPNPLTPSNTPVAETPTPDDETIPMRFAKDDKGKKVS
ncbi:MAG: hypothetical protein AB7O96_17715 [Pseudobdellovibrionaceae bacterium]